MMIEVLWILFAVLLIVACAVLLVLEIFIPSLGLLTVFALAALAGGISIFFRIGPTAGWVGVWMAVVLVPAVWAVLYKLMPRTRIGRLLALHRVEDSGGGIPDLERLQSLQGRQGVVEKPLRPVGVCRFDDQAVTCVAETGFVEKDTAVEVIHVEGNKITVRPCGS